MIARRKLIFGLASSLHSSIIQALLQKTKNSNGDKGFIFFPCNLQPKHNAFHVCKFFSKHHNLDARI